MASGVRGSGKPKQISIWVVVSKIFFIFIPKIWVSWSSLTNQLAMTPSQKNYNFHWQEWCVTGRHLPGSWGKKRSVELEHVESPKKTTNGFFLRHKRSYNTNRNIEKLELLVLLALVILKNAWLKIRRPFLLKTFLVGLYGPKMRAIIAIEVNPENLTPKKWWLELTFPCLGVWFFFYPNLPNGSGDG